MKLAVVAASAFARPSAIALFPVACGAFLLAGGSQLALTLVLSVLAITVTQLLLYVGGRRDAAMHAKLDSLVAAIPDADDELIGSEAE